jgi:CMP-2-keto-3-deoxyoctulosonic acid synthetase
VVATDNTKILTHVISFGGEAVITAESHPSGTDRVFEALNLQSEKYDYVINIQGDEPFIAPEQIDLLASLLDSKTELATLIKKIDSDEQLFNPNIVKVVVNQLQEGIYFSRSPIHTFATKKKTNGFPVMRFTSTLACMLTAPMFLEKLQCFLFPV